MKHVRPFGQGTQRRQTTLLLAANDVSESKTNPHILSRGIHGSHENVSFLYGTNKNKGHYERTHISKKESLKSCLVYYLRWWDAISFSSIGMYIRGVKVF